MSLIDNTDPESEIAMSLIVNTDPDSDNEKDGLKFLVQELEDRQAELTKLLAHADKKIIVMKGIIGTQAGEITNLKDALVQAETLMKLMRESKEKVVSLFHPKTENKASQANIEIVTATAKEEARRTRTSKKFKNKFIQAPIMATDFYKTKKIQTYNGRKQRGTQYNVGDTEVRICSDSEDIELRTWYRSALLDHFYDTDDGF